MESKQKFNILSPCLANNKEITKKFDIIEYVKRKAFNITNIINPSYTVQKAAILAHSEAVRYIKDVYPLLQVVVLKKNYGYISIIKNPCERAQIYIAKYYPAEFFHIDNPCEKAQKIAYKKLIDTKLFFMFRFIKNPCYDLQLHALYNYPKYFDEIRNPVQELLALRRMM